jgi:diacylglycerol O-acyltransferase
MHQLSKNDTVMLLQEAPHAPNQIGPILICDSSTGTGEGVTFTGTLKVIEECLHLAPSFRRRLARVPFGLDHAY